MLDNRNRELQINCIVSNVQTENIRVTLTVNGRSIDNVDISDDKNSTLVSALISSEQSSYDIECVVSIPESNYTWRQHERYQVNAITERIPYLPLISSASSLNLQINFLLLTLVILQNFYRYLNQQ